MGALDPGIQDDYIPRIADGLLQSRLVAAGAVLVQGPKWCGKTKTSARHARSHLFMQDPDMAAELKSIAEVKPSLLLAGEEPRLIDEWQAAPELWDAVRFSLDRSPGRGRYILTGSSTPALPPAHSGVGRIAPLAMGTMTLRESGDSTGEISIASLFAREVPAGGLAKADVEDYAQLICRGGWPEAVKEPNAELAREIARLYVEELLTLDIPRMDGTRRNQTWMRQILESYARNISTEAALTTIAADMGGEPPSMPTVADYVDALRRAWVLDDLPAWTPRLRSRMRVRTSPTRHLSDPSIAAALLGCSPETLLFSWSTFGLLFESLCVHDLRIYAQALGGRLYHYRDKGGLEADAVIVLANGSWAPVEVKLGERQVEDAAKHLRELRDRVSPDAAGAPVFLLVVTAGRAAYVRDDGVIVAPLAMLGP